MHRIDCDVLIAGFGFAGACAALEAADTGAQVVIIDRFSRGGASRLSGGQVYAGGGTRQQTATGHQDSPDNMARYLSAETGGCVQDGLIEAFADASVDNMEWLQQKQGVPFSDTFAPIKSSQPPAGIGLCYSGNERQYTSVADPAPRSHHADGPGLTGFVIFDVLEQRVRDHPNITVIDNARLAALALDDGVEAVIEVVNPNAVRNVARWYRIAQLGALTRTRFHGWTMRRLDRYQHAHSTPTTVHASAVVLATGGFSHNPAMLREHAAPFAGTVPLGTPGDAGDAVALTSNLGVRTRSLDRCAASRFLYPPEALLRGVIVDRGGNRLCDESLYGSSISDVIAAAGGKAWLIIDATIHRDARTETHHDPERLRDHRLSDILAGHLNHVVYRRLAVPLNLHVNRRKASTLAQLGDRIGVDGHRLEMTVKRYNTDTEDEHGKPTQWRGQVIDPPFYAIPLALDSLLFPATSITLGGLDTTVDGHVIGSDGNPVHGLFAAGRAAAGMCAGGYVSGLSIGDCIHSGRTAGRTAATACLATADS